MAADRPFLGVLLMVGFCFLAPTGDAVAKILGGTIPLLELLLARFGAQALLMVPVLIWARASLKMPRRVLRMTLLRTVLHIVGIGAMFTSLRFLPLADALAIAFVMPFIMLLLGKFVLGEEIGPRRLIACVVGFIGTLLVIQPSFANVGAPALLPLVVAVVFALFMLVTRQIAKEADPIALQALSGAFGVPMLVLLLPVGGLLDINAFTLVTPERSEAALLVVVGILGTFAHLLMTWSLRFAPSATLAPVQYLEIPVATVLGWMVFRDLPGGLAAFGIAIIISAGLVVIYHERRPVLPQPTNPS